MQQYHIQLIAPEPPKSEEPVKPVKLEKPVKREESIEKSEEYDEECEEIEEYTEDSTTSSDDKEEKQIIEDCAELLTKLVVDALGIHESEKSEKQEKSEKPEKQEIDEEKINSLIADALNKFKEEQKPTDMTQMNIQQHAKSNTEAEKVVKDAEVLRCDPTKQ